MRAKIDCLAYQALSAERHLRRVSNAEYLAFLRQTVWSRLSAEQQTLYEKLLAKDRSRYVAVADFDRVTVDDHQTRYRAYKTQLESLAIKCLDELMTQVEVPPEQIRLIITNHTVAGICPPLSSLVANRLGLPPSVAAIDLGFMGCASAVYGCELAWRLLRPGEVAIVLSAELTSAATNLAASLEGTAANAVFGDGVGAFLLARPPHRFRSRLRLVDFGGSLLCTDEALDCIRYEPAPAFFEVQLKDTIPSVAGQGIQEALRPVVRRNLVSYRQALEYVFGRQPCWQENLDYAILHTAGNKVLQVLQKHLGLSDRQVGHNFACFQKYGNTSSASIYYSLAELERSCGLKRGDRLLFLAYGSGFMTKCMYGIVS